jgi:ABC-type nickel/cobalt efflux system permease component RcnA
MTALPLLALGFLLGVRHATDPDHVVAVSTIVSNEKRWSAAGSIGALWGLGHSLTLLLVGGCIVFFGIVVPPRLGLGMELSVALMLMVLGGLNLAGPRLGIRRWSRPSPARRMSTNARPVIVGIVHGLAGSAAVALLILAAVRDAGTALAYLGLFSFGTVVGMTAMTSAIAVPFVATARRSDRTNRWMSQGTSVMSVLFGLFMAYQVGIHDGLFSGHPVWSPH